MKPGLFCLAALLWGCPLFSNATLTVEADEPIQDALLVLNGKKIAAERVSQSSFAADWNGGEASGEFRLRFRDGAQTICFIGYLEGSSFYDQEYKVIDRQCEPVPRKQ